MNLGVLWLSKASLKHIVNSVHLADFLDVCMRSFGRKYARKRTPSKVSSCRLLILRPSLLTVVYSVHKSMRGICTIPKREQNFLLTFWSIRKLLRMLLNCEWHTLEVRIAWPNHEFVSKIRKSWVYYATAILPSSHILRQSRPPPMIWVTCVVYQWWCHQAGLCPNYPY
jgi:hypothetical protein